MDIEATATGLTYDDLLAMAEDNIRRDLINGALFVTPSPTVRHQRVVLRLGALLLAHADRHGDEAHAAPLDVYLSHTSVVDPTSCTWVPGTPTGSTRPGSPDPPTW
ncbi:MAG TPA: hypothetical protein VGB28_04995 [Actinomycetota bacterium]|jgi:hypothetical protein